MYKYCYIFLTTCTSDHHVATVMSVFIKTRYEKSHVNENKHRNEGNVDVIIFHVRFCKLIRTQGGKYSQRGFLFQFGLWWY